MHCSVMGQEALEAAIANYRGIELLDDDHQEGKLICRCFAIDEGKISRAVQKHGLSTIEDVINYTKAGGACTSCHEKIEMVIDDVIATKKMQTAVTPTAATAVKPISSLPPTNALTQKILEILANLRPYLQADGGDVNLIKATENLIVVSLSGACTGCMMTDMTLAWLQEQFSEALGWAIPVVNHIPESQLVAEVSL